MKLAGRNHIVTDRSLLETMRTYKDMGYDGMELSVLRGMTNAIVWDYMEDYVIDRVRAFSEENNFPISAVSCHKNYVKDDVTLEAQKRLLRTAKCYGTDIVIVSTFMDFFERELNEKEVYDLLVKRTRILCDVAEENGVKLAIEVEPNQLFHNMRIFYEVADKLNSPAFKLNLDVGHLFLSEPDLIKAIEDAKDFTVHCHIDNMGRGEHCHKLPWLGDIDLKAAFDAIRANGYDGFAALDIYIQDYLEVSPECIRWIHENVF